MAGGPHDPLALTVAAAVLVTAALARLVFSRRAGPHGRIPARHCRRNSGWTARARLRFRYSPPPPSQRSLSAARSTASPRRYTDSMRRVFAMSVQRVRLEHHEVGALARLQGTRPRPTP